MVLGVGFGKIFATQSLVGENHGALFIFGGGNFVKILDP